mmetsp:Transcript_71517/g.155363  ORF Transcript_71517/g.155363 Transcript_71517/m.155363 type:complete len:344 (+) Transcript_71517:44-1075(+)
MLSWLPLLVVGASQAFGATIGCSNSVGLLSGDHSLTLQDPDLGTVQRRYVLEVPEMPEDGWPSEGVPLLLGFHGQGGNPDYWPPRTYLSEMVQAGWVAAYPAGLNENGDKTWNCGTGGDNSTCIVGTTGTRCMDSCRKLGQCGRCNWATCYDDVAFVKRLIFELEQSLCLNPSRYFVVGESNGGMFTHYLIQRLPGTFAAAVPIYGSPLLGYLVGGSYELLTQPGKLRTSLLQLHDRSDLVIPWEGAASSDGWLYESRARSVGAWAAVHGCGLSPVEWSAPFTGGPRNLKCYEHPNCNPGRRVVFCAYDGRHGEWPDQRRTMELLRAFFESVSGVQDLRVIYQ